MSALLIEPGSSMTYFTGVQWWRSERLTAVILPREGEPAIVTPHFEEPSVRESLKVPADVRIWNEHENPLDASPASCATGASPARSGSRRRCASSRSTACASAMPGVEIRPGAPVVRGCRMIKSPHEIALMQKAADITIAAYRYTAPRIERGMTPGARSARS